MIKRLKVADVCRRYGGVEPSDRKHHELHRPRRLGADSDPRHR